MIAKEQQPASLIAILCATGRVYWLEPDEIARDRGLPEDEDETEARQVVAYLARRRTRHSLPQIAAVLGYGDASSVGFAALTITKRLAVGDQRLRLRIEAVIGQLVLATIPPPLRSYVHREIAR